MKPRRVPINPSKKRFGRRRAERGAVLAEFAIIMPVLVVLLFAIIQFAIAFNRHQAVHAAAREGARVGSLPTADAGEACARVTAALVGINFSSPPSCSVSYVGGGSCENADSVHVTVSADHRIDLALAGGYDVTITGEGDFRCE